MYPDTLHEHILSENQWGYIELCDEGWVEYICISDCLAWWPTHV
jgi:hypothetical protein